MRTVRLVNKLLLDDVVLVPMHCPFVSHDAAWMSLGPKLELLRADLLWVTAIGL